MESACPACKAASVIAGHVAMGGEGGYGSLFAPLHCRTSWGMTGVRLPALFRACTSCGLVWSAINPGELRTFIETNGQEVARQQLESLLYGIYRDLPDSSLAREAADKAAEVDSLMLEDRTPAATRRYRELSGCTWDQAIRDLRHWNDLSREQKLALFGWEPKSPPTKDKDPPLDEHPLRDPWLDEVP